jgi:hypothetical protein
MISLKMIQSGVWSAENQQTLEISNDHKRIASCSTPAKMDVE